MKKSPPHHPGHAEGGELPAGQPFVSPQKNLHDSPPAGFRSQDLVAWVLDLDLFMCFEGDFQDGPRSLKQALHFGDDRARILFDHDSHLLVVSTILTPMRFIFYIKGEF